MSQRRESQPADGSRRRPTFPRRTLLIAVTVVFSVAVGIVLFDIVLFWFDQRNPQPRAADVAIRQRSSAQTLLEATPGGHRTRRFLDTDIVGPFSGRTIHVRTNALGYRGGPIGPKPPDEYRILVLGDSITFSADTPEDETYPFILEQLLRENRRNVRVLNAGVYGAGLREELLVLHETGLLTQPDMVVVGLFLNDAARSRMFPIPRGLTRYSALARRLAESRLANEALHECRAEYERLSGKPFPQRNFSEDAWRTDPAAFEKRVAEAAADWGRAWFQWAWDEMRPDLEIMRQLGKQHGFEFVVALFPVSIQIESELLDDRPQQMFRSMMVELDVRHIDLLTPLRDAYQRHKRPLAFDHAHLRLEGNRIAAAALASVLSDLMSRGESE